MREFWKEIGYEPLTTFWEDFSIADRFVIDSNIEPVEDTYRRALEYAKTDYKIFTELVMVANHKIWQWYKKDAVLAIVYNTIWKDAEEKFHDIFDENKEAMEYFYRITD